MNNNSLIYSWSFHHLDYKNPRDFLLQECFNEVLNFEKSYGLSPSLIGLKGKGFSNNKITHFKKGLQQLENNCFDNLESFNLYTTISESLDFAFYWKILVSISISKIFGTQLYVGFNFELLKNYQEKIIEELIKPLSNSLNPQYGYAYISEVGEGPFGYSAGFVHTPDNYVLADDKKELITKWINNIDLIYEGKIRDLYQINILSGLQMSSQINGYSLQNWIVSDLRRGTLTPFNDNLFLWVVPLDSYDESREILSNNGLLITYDQYVLPTILVSE
jgi:hypothetical protein